MDYINWNGTTVESNNELSLLPLLLKIILFWFPLVPHVIYVPVNDIEHKFLAQILNYYKYLIHETWSNELNNCFAEI